MEVVKMHMLRLMCDHTMIDSIRNEVITMKLEVAPISTKLCEGRLRWFGHM